MSTERAGLTRCSSARASLNTTSAGAHHSASSVGIAHSAANSIPSWTCESDSVSERRFATASWSRSCGAGFAIKSNNLPPSIAAVAPTAIIMPRTNTTPSEQSAKTLERKPWNNWRTAGAPPRSWVHAAARKPTAKTGFSNGAARPPMNGMKSANNSIR